MTIASYLSGMREYFKGGKNDKFKTLQDSETHYFWDQYFLSHNNNNNKKPPTRIHKKVQNTTPLHKPNFARSVCLEDHFPPLLQ